MKRYFDFDINDYKDKKCNFHSHTVRCQHAVGEEREYVEEAIKEGFEVIGFSDHSPYLFKNGYVSRIRMTMSQLEDYVKTIETLKKNIGRISRFFWHWRWNIFRGSSSRRSKRSGSIRWIIFFWHSISSMKMRVFMAQDLAGRTRLI